MVVERADMTLSTKLSNQIALTQTIEVLGGEEEKACGGTDVPFARPASCCEICER